VVAEFYPRAHDPVLGIWAHRQAMAARDAGAEVRVVVLHRPIPPLSTPRRELRGALGTLLRQPAHAVVDGLEIDYVRFVAPPRPRSYGSWGAWAAPPLAAHLRRLRRRWPFDLVHAHSAVPAGEAVRRSRIGVPVVRSRATAHERSSPHDQQRRGERGARRVRRALPVWCAANSREDRALLSKPPRRDGETVRRAPGHRRAGRTCRTSAKEARRSYASRTSSARTSARATSPALVWSLRDRQPRLPRHLIVGRRPPSAPAARGPRAPARPRPPASSSPASSRQPRRRCRATWSGHLFVLPSIDEAFGVAYVEAMAGGLPAIACLGEPGPAEIEEAGPGIQLVAPGDIPALAAAIDRELSRTPREQRERAARARQTVERSFTWERCGRATLRVYERALT
jgi:glycosyltransferase involved in cell wall biosynthesis